MRTTVRLLAAAALATTLVACGGDADTGAAADPPVVDGDSASDDATGDDGSVDDDSDDTSMPADDVEPTDGVTEAEAEAVANAYLGLTEAEAEAQAEVDDRPYRVGARDGEQFMLTEDYVIGRITVTITDGTVTAATVEADENAVTAEA